MSSYHLTLSPHVSSNQNGEVDPALKALEQRQDEILRRLYELKAAVDGLAKTVTTPDADLDATSLSSAALMSAPKEVADLDSLLGKVWQSETLSKEPAWQVFFGYKLHV